jgi:hypothetical protein
MTQDEANLVITEAMGYEDIHYAGGWKYHNKALDEERGGAWSSPIPDYFTPVGFFIAWNWAKEQDWWWEFIYKVTDVEDAIIDMIDPAVFPMKLAEWLKGRE